MQSYKCTTCGTEFADCKLENDNLLRVYQIFNSEIDRIIESVKNKCLDKTDTFTVVKALESVKYRPAKRMHSKDAVYVEDVSK